MRRIPKASELALAAFSIFAASPLLAAPFAPGNLVVARVGTGAGALSNASTAVFLDEYTTSGTFVQSIAMPTAAVLSQQPLTFSGTAASEGYLTRSVDKRFLVLTGYGAAPGVGAVNTTATTTTNRVLGRIAADGTMDTSTAFNGLAFSGSNVRGAATVDGSTIWATGTAATASNGGVWHQAFGTNGAGTQISTTFTNLRAVDVFGGQLFTSSGGGALRLGAVGTGTPTTTGQTTTSLPGLPTAGISPYGFVMLDRDGSPGLDTIYLSDDTGASVGIRKYSLNAGTWVDQGVVGPQIRGLTGIVSGGNAVLYGTTSQANANSLVVLTDSAAFNAPISGTQSNLVTAAANTAFRGVAFTPEAGGPVTPVLSIGATSVAEGDPGCAGGTSIMSFTVSANPAPTSQLTFNFGTSAGTATPGIDYTEVPSGTGTIAANATSGTAQLLVTCDHVIEANETLTATLANGSGYTINGAANAATGTINNDDLASIRIADLSRAEGSGGGISVFPVAITLDNNKLAPAGGITIEYVLQESLAPTATDGVDFLSPTPEPGILMIPEFSTGATLNISVISDNDIESNENFQVALSNASVGVLADAISDIVIVDDDAVIPAITINDVSVTEGDSGGPAVNAVFTVSISPPPTGTVNVTATTADGTAVDVGDYQLTSTVLTFDGANTSRQVTVPIVHDCTIESAEQFVVNLSGLSGAAASIGDSQGVGTISDNDVAINASIAFVPPSANEGDTGTNTRTFRVSLSQAMQCGSFNYSVTSTGGSAAAGTDYVAVSTGAQSLSGASTSADFTVTVNGDLTNETDETIELTLAGTGTNVTVAPTATGTLLNDDPLPLTIEEIQGTGVVSTFATQTVTTIGNVVTAVLPAPNGGFIMQMPDAAASADPLSSNGIFVFTGASPTVQVGDEVTVRGQVVEFNTGAAPADVTKVTEFTNTGLIVQVTGSGRPMPTAIVLDATRPSPNPATPTCGVALGNFECMESMRVTTSTGMVNLGNQTFGTDPVAELWITTTGQRAFRDGGLAANRTSEIPPTLTPPAPPVPSTYVYDGNPEVFELDMDRAGLPNTIVTPGTSFTATGVLSQEFGGFEIFPTAFTVNTAGPALPAPVPEPLPTQLTIASVNLHLLFDDVNDPWNAADCTAADVDFCPTTERWNAKLNLLSRAIREVLRTPMVIAAQEIEKQGALQGLANKLNTDLAGAFTYTAHVGAIDDLDGGHQNVGYLIRNDVTIGSLTQQNTTQTWVFNGADQGEVMDRPPYLLQASVSRAGKPFQFAVMNVHQRSLTGIDDLTPLADHIDAHRVRQKRLYQAALTAQAIQVFRAANADLPFFVVGDFNAFPESDGYTDVTGIIKGTTDPALSEYDLSFFGLEGTGVNGNIVNPPLTSGRDLTPADEQYSYLFQSRPQQIDHAMMGTAGLAVFDDMVFGRWNVDQQARYLINFNNSLGTETPLVSSDHDAFVLYIDAATDAMFRDGFE